MYTPTQALNACPTGNQPVVLGVGEEEGFLIDPFRTDVCSAAKEKSRWKSEVQIRWEGARE